MLITRKSLLTGKTTIKEINVTKEQLEKWQSGTLIQLAMPNLTSVEREFIKTGYTEEDWAKMFSAEEKEEKDKTFRVFLAETLGKLGEFKLSEVASELSVDEEYFPVKERSNEEQEIISKFKTFIENSEVGETLACYQHQHGDVIYQRVS